MSTHPAQPERLAASSTLGGSDDCAVSDTTWPLGRPKIDKMPNSDTQGVEGRTTKKIAVPDVHNICGTLTKPVTRDRGADFTGVKWLYASKQHGRRQPDPQYCGRCAPATAAVTTAPTSWQAQDSRRIQRVPGLFRHKSGTIRQRIDVTPMIAPQVSSS
jgi:hypothetical protein